MISSIFDKFRLLPLGFVNCSFVISKIKSFFFILKQLIITDVYFSSLKIISYFTKKIINFFNSNRLPIHITYLRLDSEIESENIYRWKENYFL